MKIENPYPIPDEPFTGASDILAAPRHHAWDEGYHSRDEEVAALEDKIAAAANLASMTLRGIEARQQARNFAFGEGHELC